MTESEQSQAAGKAPELRPPDSGSPAITKTRSNRSLVWVAMSLVVVIVLLVLLLLPRLVSQNNVAPVANTPSTVTPSESTRPDTPASENSRRDAEQALQEFLLTRARLELANAPAWGDPEWSEALEGADRGNRLFAQQQFPMAAEILAKSLALLQLIESERGLRLSNALDSGWQALQSNDSEAAAVFFTTALSIDENNEDALTGLERAAVRPELLRLMTQGELALAMNDLQAAQATYLDATLLDGDYEPATVALLEINLQLKELAFKDAMSRTLSAMDAGQLATAETALREAESLKPAEQVVIDTRQLLIQEQQEAWLNQQRRMALKYEHDEDWQAAITTYRKVLAKVPQAAFARRGLDLAGDRLRLHQQFDHYLEDPARLYTPQPRANAEKLIASAGTPPAAETRLAGKTKRLQTLLTEASTPLTVTLQSDGLTHVQIYHVGELGQFTSQQLELRPGTYTVIGSRPGYRNVRHTITVKPGTTQPVVDIRCEETV